MRFLTLFSLTDPVQKVHPASLSTPSTSSSSFYGNNASFGAHNNQTAYAVVHSAPETPLAHYISSTTATPQQLIQSQSHRQQHHQHHHHQHQRSATVTSTSTPSTNGKAWQRRPPISNSYGDDDYNNDDDDQDRRSEHSDDHDAAHQRNAHEQLLLLDDSEIEGSPRPGSKTPAQYKLANGMPGGSAIVNSTPLTTHVLGGYRKSRRDVSVVSMK